MESLGDRGGAPTASGKPSTDKNVLERLAKTNPFYRDLLSLSAISKVRSTYCEGMERLLDSNSRVHGKTMHRPSTGRLSMIQPNLTNVVGDKDGEEAPAAGFRKTVEASPGCMLLEADAAAVEAVLTGYFMKDPNYIRLAQLGVHDFLTSHMVGKPPSLEWPAEKLGEYFKEIKAAHKKERSLAKTIVHASNFGQTPWGMVKRSPEKFTLKTASELQQLYFQILPRVKPWHEELRLRAQQQGYLGLEDHPWRYRHWFWQVFKWDHQKQQTTFGKDCNRVVAYYPQSTNAGFQKEVALRVAARSKGFFFGKTPIRALIHDSVLAEQEERFTTEMIKICQEEMTRPVPELPCPPEWQLGPFLSIGCSVKVGKNWAAMEEVSSELGTASDTAPKEEEEEEDAGI